MPIYSVKCTDIECGKKKDVSCSSIEYSNGVLCVCGSVATRDWSAPLCLGVDETIGQYSEGLGCVVENTSHRNKIMKDKNLDALSGKRSAKDQLGYIRKRAVKDKELRKEKLLNNIMTKELDHHRG